MLPSWGMSDYKNYLDYSKFEEKFFRLLQRHRQNLLNGLLTNELEPGTLLSTNAHQT